MTLPEPVKFTYMLVPAQRMCLLRFTGNISLGDVTGGIERLWADPGYDPLFNGIVNLDGVTTRAGLDELQALIGFLRKRPSSEGQWVAVFSEPKPTALAMMFKAAWKGAFNIEIVSTWDAACRHLRLDLPAFAPEG